jgi:hypothetical protein
MPSTRRYQLCPQFNGASFLLLVLLCWTSPLEYVSTVTNLPLCAVVLNRVMWMMTVWITSQRDRPSGRPPCGTNSAIQRSLLKMIMFARPRPWLWDKHPTPPMIWLGPKFESPLLLVLIVTIRMVGGVCWMEAQSLTLSRNWINNTGTNNISKSRSACRCFFY